MRSLQGINSRCVRFSKCYSYLLYVLFSSLSQELELEGKPKKLSNYRKISVCHTTWFRSSFYILCVRIRDNSHYVLVIIIVVLIVNEQVKLIQGLFLNWKEENNRGPVSRTKSFTEIEGVLTIISSFSFSRSMFWIQPFPFIPCQPLF